MMSFPDYKIGSKKEYIEMVENFYYKTHKALIFNSMMPFVN